MFDPDRTARQAREGDREALSRFVTSVQPDVWRFCAHLTRPDDADDLMQETLMRVVTHLGRWERGPVMTWVLGVARNVCFEHLRRRGRRPVELRAEPEARTHDDMTGVVDTLQLLAELPYEQREALVLTQLIGLPYLEAADIVGCPVGTIRSRVARGRTTLAARLQRTTGRRDNMPPAAHGS